MRSSILSLACASLFGLTLLGPGPARAQSWSAFVSPKGGAGGEVSAGGKSLRISCTRQAGPVLFLNLAGGPHAGMKNVDDGNDSMMMWITLPDGRKARHPIHGHYFAPDRTFVGRFHSSGLVLDQFAQGSRMEVTSATGDTVFSVPMSGTAKVRAALQQGCGL